MSQPIGEPGGLRGSRLETGIPRWQGRLPRDPGREEPKSRRHVGALGSAVAPMPGLRCVRFLPREPRARGLALALALALLAASGLGGCGKSADEQATARRLSMEKALAASRAE